MLAQDVNKYVEDLAINSDDATESIKKFIKRKSKGNKSTSP